MTTTITMTTSSYEALVGVALNGYCKKAKEMMVFA